MKTKLRFGALLAALVCAVAARAYCDDLPNEVVDLRPTIRFCDYSTVAPEVPMHQPMREPLGPAPVTLNSYWEKEQSAALQPPAPANEIPVPPAPGFAENVAAGCANGACGQNDCCTGCGGCSCSACRRPIQLIALAESTFFFPQIRRDFLSNTIVNTLGTQVYQTNSQLASAEGSLLIGPRLTLGLQGCKWGVVGRYWNGSNCASTFVPAVSASPFTGVTSYDGFNAYTADIEVQRRFVGCKWQWYGFLGARYASIDNDRTLTVSNSFGGETFSSTSFTGQRFNGAGLTFGLWGVRPLRDCSPLSLFYANRYSFVWGTGSASSQTSATAFDSQGFASTTNGAEAGNSGDLFIAELQLGVQWNGKLQCLPGLAFVRTAFEYQYWDTNSGLATGANSTAFINNFSASASASAGDLLFHLPGLTVGVGLMY